jgi:hypothetical protein
VVYFILFFAGISITNQIHRPDPPTPSLNLYPQPDCYPLCITSAELKVKLNTSFKEAHDEAIRRSGKKTEVQHQKMAVYRRLLDAVGNHCGACYTQGRMERHAPMQCTCIADKQIFEALRQKIQYPKDGGPNWNGPCYTCHIHSFSANLFHGPFTAGHRTCANRDLALPLLTVIWEDPVLRAEMAQQFGQCWNTLDNYIVWLGKPMPEHFTATMAIIWYWSSTRL